MVPSRSTTKWYPISDHPLALCHSLIVSVLTSLPSGVALQCRMMRLISLMDTSIPPWFLCLTLDFHSPCLACVGAFLSAYSLVPTRVLYQRTFRDYRGQRSLPMVTANVTRCLGPFLVTKGRSLVRSLCEYKAT